MADDYEVSNECGIGNEGREKPLGCYAEETRVWKSVISFRQNDGEMLWEVWERFKELLRKCPSHGIPDRIQMEYFYFGLDAQTQLFVDVSARFALLEKTYEEYIDFMERIADNNYQQQGYQQEYGSSKRQNPVQEMTPMEKTFAEYMVRNDAVIQKQAKIIQSQAVSIRNLENQMQQVATALSNARFPESRPSDAQNPT